MRPRLHHLRAAALLALPLHFGCTAHAPPPPPVVAAPEPPPAPPPPSEPASIPPAAAPEPRFRAETTINFVDEVGAPLQDGPDIEVITAAPKKAKFESLVKSKKRPPAEEPILDDDEKK